MRKNCRRFPIFLLLLLSLAVSTSAHGQWALLSDFDALALGDLGSQGSWSTAGPSSIYQIVVDPNDATNQALRANRDATGSDPNAYIPLGSGIAEGATGTLFFRMRNESLGDLVFGSSDSSSPSTWNDYEGYMRMNAGDIEVRDGGAFKFGGTYNEDEWTNIWLVLNNQSDTITLYSSVGSASAIELATGDFRNGTTSTLVTANLRMGAAHLGMNGYLDDIYLASGELLSLPINSLSLGDVNGDGNVDIENDFAAIRDHFKQSVTSRQEGDLNASNFVDFADYRLWKNDFLAQGGSLQGISLFVPEPTTLWLLATCGVMGFSCLRFRGTTRFRHTKEPGNHNFSRPASPKGRGLLTLGCVCCLIAGSARSTSAQLVGPVGNPIPESIVKSGLTVEISDYAQLPDTTNSIGSKPDRINTTTRINFLRESPDGRHFVNDLRGQLYVLGENQQPQVYVDLDQEGQSIFPNMNFDKGLGAGFTTFAFHPEFETNGLFYTVHSEKPNGQSPSPTFTVPDHTETGASIKYHQIITEWDAANPANNSFSGTRREIARYGLTANNYFHVSGDMSFNPHSNPGDVDYGLMYISGGDWGFINGTSPDQVGVDGRPTQLQRLDTLAGTMMRIDPRSPSVTGGPSGHGDYTIPTDNPYFEDGNSDNVDDNPNTFGEIWAHGFRNGHRMAWAPGGKVLVSNIGQAHLESTYFVEPGDNFGWPRREGNFINGVNEFYTIPGDLDHGANGDSSDVFQLPTTIANGSVDDGFSYPVVQFDHSEGFAHAGGFVYNGTGVPQLRGKFIFGEIVNGRVFYADYADLVAADDGVPETEAEVFELQLTQNDVEVELGDLVPGRVDLRFAMDAEGELYLLTKGDGAIRKLVAPDNLVLLVDEISGQATLRNEMSSPITLDGYSIFSEDAGLLPDDGLWLSLDDQDIGGVGSWQEASPTTSEISELSTGAGLVFQPGDEIDLGQLWNTTKNRDLQLEVQLLGGTDTITSQARFYLPGDFNDDGQVNEQDLTHPVLGWQVRYGNDLSAADFLLWQRNFGTSSTIAAAQQVPEPSLLAVLLLVPLLYSESKLCRPKVS